ncbi:hypothetical protein FRC01_011888, partial [Tulasnella sp. 417]
MSRRARSPSLHEEETDGRPLKQAKLTFFSAKKKAGDDSATQDPAKPANQPNAPLKSLLDLSEVENGQLQARFDAIADALIHRSRLQVVNGDKIVKYQILEAEFYLRDSARHWDPFTHGEEEQRFSGKWYFHRMGRWQSPNTPSNQLTAYRSGTRKGLDLTVGGPLEPPSESSSSSAAPSGATDVRGGILLRTIKNETNGNVTCGPSLLVDELLRAAGANDITDMVQSKMNNDRHAFFESPDPSADPPAPLP